MRRRTIYRLSACLTFFVLVFFGFVFWVFGTSEGARWAIGEVSSRTSVIVHAKKIEGRIWGDLLLKGVTVRRSDVGLNADSIHLRWKPVSLIYGKLNVSEVVLNRVRLWDDRPETKEVAEIAWPRITGLLSHINADVDVFSVRGLTYRRGEASPLHLDNIFCRIGWRKGVLTIEGLKMQSPPGRVEGTLRAGFVRPALTLELAFFPAEPRAGLDMISVDAGLHARQALQTIKGDVHLVGSSHGSPRVEFSSRLEVGRRLVRLRDFTLKRMSGRGTVTGSGEVSFSGGGPRFRLGIRTVGLDLSPFLHAKTNLSAEVVLEGTSHDYHGRLDLSNKGDSLRSVQLAGSFRGNGDGVKIDSITGAWLGGAIRGTVSTGWEEKVSVLASLQIRDLKPSMISPEWTGQINADASGSATLAGNKPMTASFRASLLKSRLRGKVLTGEVKAGLVGSNLLIERLLLRGKGFNVTASGELLKRITFAADISDLAGLVPGAHGELNTRGWVRWYDRLLSGNVDGRARKIEMGDLHIGAADFSGRTSGSKGYPFQLLTTVSELVYKRVKIRSARLSAGGTLADHVVELEVRSPGATITSKLSGGYKAGKWLGRISGLSEKDASGVLRLKAPSALLISSKKFSFSRLVLNGTGGEHIEAAGELTLHPLQGSVDAEWASVDLGRANYWLEDLSVTGKSSGGIHALWLRNVLQQVSARAEASGSLVVDDQKISIRHASVQVVRDEHKLLASFDLGMGKAGIVKGRLSSVVKSGVLLPEQGTVDAELHDLDISLFQRWVPEELEVGGMVSGSIKGRLLAEQHLDIEGGASISGGAIRRQTEKGEISVLVRKADMKFAWNNSSLKGTVSLTLQDYGYATGSFSVPLEASLPLLMKGNGPVNVSLKGRLREEGILGALFPGLVQETHGLVDFSIKAGGTWNRPDYRGEMHLSKAGAYFPTGGIHVKDAGMSAHLEGERLIVDSFQATSGTGKIGGSAEILFKNGMVVSYKGKLAGKDFRVIYLPELRMEASPDLTFEGSNKELSVRGEIKIPYLLVLESKTKTPVRPSKDVIIVDSKAKPANEVKTAVDIEVRVILGDRVFVKAEGIDAQMGGSIDLTARGVNDIRGRGEIHVVKGKYSAYGVSLDIERGRVIFSGQKISSPGLDVLAFRKAGDVKAGVTVTGTPQNPVVKLYAEPSMADTDILAYIVLGHPLGSGQQQQADVVARAAGFLLSASDSVVFQDQLKRRLGIDTLDIESVKTGEETVPGGGQEGVSRSLVTVGKYLTPKLYISYGRSLLGDTNLFRTRYMISKHWEIESESGTESGADLFYKIDLK